MFPFLSTSNPTSPFFFSSSDLIFFFSFILYLIQVFHSAILLPFLLVLYSKSCFHLLACSTFLLALSLTRLSFRTFPFLTDQNPKILLSFSPSRTWFDSFVSFLRLTQLIPFRPVPDLSLTSSFNFFVRLTWPSSLWPTDSSSASHHYRTTRPLPSLPPIDPPSSQPTIELVLGANIGWSLYAFIWSLIIRGLNNISPTFSQRCSSVREALKLAEVSGRILFALFMWCMHCPAVVRLDGLF